MKIRYTLIIAAIAAALGYCSAPAVAKWQKSHHDCNPKQGCIDFDKHPELIGGGAVLEPAAETEKEQNHET